MAGYVAAAAVNGWETLCCILFFRAFTPMRSVGSRVKVWAVIGFQVFFCMISEYCAPGRFYVRVAAVSLTISLVMLYLFQVRYLTSLVLAMFFLGLEAVMEYLSMIAAGWFMPFARGDIRTSPKYALILLISRAMLFVGILLMGKIMKGKPFHVLTNREWGILFISTFITLVTFTGIAAGVRPYDDSLLLFALTILVIDYVVYYLIDEIMDREIRRKEDEVFRERVKYETAMYHSISENLDSQRKRTHEYKNQIAVIRALAAKGQYQKLLSYVEKADERLCFGLDAIDTNHVIVNAVLNTKYREATSKGMVFVLKANDLSKLHLRDEDVVLILSNLLNNAMEACEQAREKVIKLKFIWEDGQTVISVKNSLAYMPVMENGKFLTSKTANAPEHGMGVRNVIETVKNYGGKYSIDFEKDGFLFSIILPNPKA